MLAPASRCNPIVGGTTRKATRMQLVTAHYQSIQNRSKPHASFSGSSSHQNPLHRCMRMDASNSTAGVCRAPPISFCCTPAQPQALPRHQAQRHSTCGRKPRRCALTSTAHCAWVLATRCSVVRTPRRRCEDESIDEIAAFLGVGEQVAALTARCAWKTNKKIMDVQPYCNAVHHTVLWPAASSFKMHWLPASI